MNATGRREARVSWLGRLVARAGARELAAFVVPGPEIARARGLDLAAAGLRVADTPRHANVLVLVGEVPAGLRDAAAIAYAQMPRPRAILAVGAGDVSPLPGPDVSVSDDRGAMAAGVAELRRLFAENAFGPGAADYDVEAVRTQTEYACSMHPEVVRDEPGSCPVCGMDLVPREAAMADMDHEGGGHGDEERMDHGSMHHEEPEEEQEEPDGGHGGVEHERRGQHGPPAGSGDHEPAKHGETGHGRTGRDRNEAAARYTCPMHPGVVSDEPGKCPECGMDLVPSEDDGAARGHSGHAGMRHGDASEEHGSREGMDGGMDHEGMGFMSMVEMTRGTPRSSDGLQMEWVEAPFGPLFPGLPGGFALTFTLDGDTVAGTEAAGRIGGRSPDEALIGSADGFVDRAGRLDALSPAAYRLLALRTVEDAAGVIPDERTALARAGALERGRAASHLGWLAGFGHLLGYAWLEERAARLQLALLGAEDAGAVAGLAGGAKHLRRRVERNPLLRRKLAALGNLDDGAGVRGPVARASGRVADERIHDEVYRSLGFEPVVLGGDDALSRLRVRLAEVEQSLDLVRRTGAVVVPDHDAVRIPATGAGAATVETPRGAATLRVTFEGGEVVGAGLDPPSARHVALVGAVTEQQEFASALVAVASLDLSPWEVAG